MDQILFYVFAAQAVLSAVLSVTRKNTVAAACWLVLMFFALAGVYVLLEAWFVAAIQVLVYAGAIMVLFLFVIMLLDLRSTELAAHKGPHLKITGVLLSVVFLGAVVYAIHDAATSETAVADRVSATLRVTGGSSRAIPLVADGPGRFAGFFEEGGTARTLSATREPAGPDGGASWRWDLTPAPPGGVNLTGTWEHALIQAPYERGQAVIEVVVQRGGLAAHAGGGPDGSARAVGGAMFERWLLPFEVVSLLLTGAIFGVVVLTKRRLA